MAHNTIEEIKKLLLLETENQTLEDQDIQIYINDANEEMVSDLKRSIEFDSFVANNRGNNTFFTYFNMTKITSVRVLSAGATQFVELDDSEYRLVRNNSGVEVDDLTTGDCVEVYSVSPNYKLLERAYTIVNFRTRLNPFKNQTIDPIYAEWIDKRTRFLKVLRGKFGTGKYSG